MAVSDTLKRDRKRLYQLSVEVLYMASFDPQVGGLRNNGTSITSFWEITALQGILGP